LRQIDRAADERRRALDSEVVRTAIQPLIDELLERHRASDDVVRFLQEVRDDLPARVIDARNGNAQRVVVENGDDDAENGDTTDDSQPTTFPPSPPGAPRFDRLARYRANPLVDHSDAPGAPVVFEPHPTPHNLAGRIEYRSIDGVLVTGVRQIKPGALHRANGGFLILRALDVLQTEASWAVLKRALMGREIRVEPFGDPMLSIPTETLAPEPIPLDVKVVLIGTARTFQLLYELEEDFQSLFKVKVEFAPDMAWTVDNLGHYAAFIARVVRDRGLHHFEAGAVARVMEHGARLREHQERLSTRLLDVADVVTEASFWSGRAGRTEVSAHDVNEAIGRREQRSNLVEEEVRRWITEGALRIETDGLRVGTLNGLSVVDVGDHQFGRPVRVTAVASPGRGLVASIERESGLSGAVHDKGVLTITGLLASMFARETPLSLMATIAFEQNYDEIEGDSASVAELVALVSAIADVPVRQCIAVTGSIDQQGTVQAVGGVNDKIEGFFALCAARGLTGEHGVVIPRTNARHLMLRDDVVDAVREGRFHVWAVDTIDDALELATGIDAASVRASAAKRLDGFAARVRWIAGGE
ncbi:MAG: Lon protease family protein, partial [Deltaproteobacteria bacterium]